MILLILMHTIKGTHTLKKPTETILNVDFFWGPDRATFSQAQQTDTLTHRVMLFRMKYTYKSHLHESDTERLRMFAQNTTITIDTYKM